MSMVHCVGVPSSSMLSEPRRRARVPSSTTVHSAAATRSPMRLANAEVPLRLKSPSRPWPMASCSRMPGQPGPSTTVMVPAGAGCASRLTSACRTASRANASGRSPAVSSASEKRPPAPAYPCSRRPSCSTSTETLKRTSGRTSAASSPSLVAMSTTSWTATRLAVTCTTRGSRRRASRSTRSSQATLSAVARSAAGSAGRYRRCPLRECQAATRRSPPCTAIARAAREASVSAGSTISSEYANPVFSPASARTPTPCSMRMPRQVSIVRSGR